MKMSTYRDIFLNNMVNIIVTGVVQIQQYAALDDLAMFLKNCTINLTEHDTLSTRWIIK